MHWFHTWSAWRKFATTDHYEFPSSKRPYKTVETWRRECEVCGTPRTKMIKV